MVARKMHCSLLFLFLPNVFLPSPSDDRNDELPPGLVATYSPGFGGQPVERIDPDIQFNWADASPDPRVPADRFEVRWQGKLFVQASGRYRFHLFAAGTSWLSIDGKQAIAGAANEAGWLSCPELQLELGHHAIEVSFTKTAERARIGLYWESNKFALEPIGPRWLFHDKAADGKPGDFERGGELVRAFRCAACHSIPSVANERNAPSLDRLASHIKSDWLVRWLENPHAIQPGARMPAMSLTRDDARAVASFLISVSKKPDTSAATTPKRGNPETGESLVQSLGCLACHTLDGRGPGAAGFGGGPLDRVADKRPAAFFREWLTKPQAVNSAHRMPTFTLSKDEVDDLASFLSTRGEPRDDAEADATHAGGKEVINRGKQLVVDHRCAACHDIPGVTKPDLVGQPLHGDRSRQRRIAWLQSCLSQVETTKPRPRFAFDEQDRRAILSFIEHLPAKVAPQSQFEFGRRLLRELTCASCHPRDLDHGLQPSIVGRAAAEGTETELAKLRGELEPPSLTSVGDKFNDATLAKLIVGGLPPRRPWLKVRMPRFEHRDNERDAIVHFLVEHDRIPANPPPGLGRSGVAGVESSSPQPIVTKQVAGGSKTRPLPPSIELEPASALTAGHQLVSARGFGCMSCHTVGKHQPKAVAVNARGSDLLKIGERVRHEWFLRWTRDPARIVPGMEMPSITVPVRGVLDDKLELQIESLWQALNSPSFVVPSDRDTAQQIISLKPGDEPVILRDVMYDCPPGSGWCPRSFAIGLPNRHNILFDLDTASLRGWWSGDFVRELTQGKTWLWEPAGLPMCDSMAKLPSVALRDEKAGQLLLPERQGQYVADLKGWMHGRVHGPPEAVTLFYTIHFRGGATLDVVECIEIAQDHEGFERSLLIEKVPAGYFPVLLQVGDSSNNSRDKLFLKGPLGQAEVANLARDGNGWTELPDLRPAGDRLRCFELPFSAREKKGPTQSFSARVGFFGPKMSAEGGGGPPAASASPVRRTVTRLQVAPGFEAIRLPLDAAVMPTALAFRADGTPVVCSLKGRLFLARDSDGDSFADTWQPFGDHLAAPFGVLTDGNDVLVSHKPELLRLGDLTGDGRASFPRVIAADWGYTEDYHDWTFGPVRDSKGNLYIATGSDYAHKDRPTDARKWRGSLLRIEPDGKIEELARGLRYPTGIAITHDDQIFITDNQGVQNTFNEINHLLPGSRYGVPALDDPPADRDPWPEREPAIKIPHPWTRSVNGICFLESVGKWGPFEGHGIGCEYDTRGLIRFSLQKIGDTYQGACYPFTLPEDQVPQDQRLLGPICCAVSPGGDLYVGGLRDSGWGGGNNVGELVRIKPSQNVPLGVREVRAWREGFVIDFTGTFDAAAAADASKYVISSYRRIWKGTYATPDSDRRTERIRKIDVAADCRSVVVTIDGMRPGFVYEVHLGSIAPEDQPFWPADAYYTLNEIPQLNAQEN